MLVLFVLFISTVWSTATGPYLQIIEWHDVASQNCPNIGNGGDGNPVNFFNAFVYEVRNVTYKKRDVDDSQAVALDCVTYNTGYGVNQFNTSLAPKNGYALGISYGTTNVTIVEYNSSVCTLGTETGVKVILNFSVCYQTTENGVAVSRIFRITPQIPPGYNSNQGPPNFFYLNYFTPDVSNGCGISVKKYQFPNNQACQKISDNLWINGYCNSSTFFAGTYYSGSGCTGTAYPMNGNGFPNVQQCYNDFTPGLGNGCIGSTCLPSAVTKIIITCSSSTLMLNFLAMAVLILSVLTL